MAANNVVGTGRLIAPTGETPSNPETINKSGADPTGKETQQQHRAGLGGNPNNPGWHGDLSIGGDSDAKVETWLPFAKAGTIPFPTPPVDPKLTNPSYVATTLSEQKKQEAYFDSKAQTDLRAWIYDSRKPGESQEEFSRRDLALHQDAVTTVVNRGDIITRGYDIKPKGITEYTGLDENGKPVKIPVSIAAKPPTTTTTTTNGGTPPTQSATREEQFNQAMAKYDGVRTTAASAADVKRLDGAINSLQKQIATDEARLAAEKRREQAKKGSVGELTKEQEEEIRQTIIKNRKSLLVSVTGLQKSLDKLNTDLTAAIRSLHGSLAMEREFETRTNGAGALTKDQETRIVNEIAQLTAQQKATLDLTSKQLLTHADQLKKLYETEQLYNKQHQGVITPEESERLKEAEKQLRSLADYGVKRQQAMNRYNALAGELSWKPLKTDDRKAIEQEQKSLQQQLEQIEKARTKGIQTRGSTGSTTVITSAGRTPKSPETMAIAPNPTTSES